MENNIVTGWQLSLLASASCGCAASALATVKVEGLGVRPSAPKAAFVAFMGAMDVATDLTTVKRVRAHAGIGRNGITAAYVPGSLTWSPPI
ncbi:MAG TPA: hypothetical protein VNS81_08650 [Nocardioides sp.]|nr:hypothetical protein [Nocardioides sp.]